MTLPQPPNQSIPPGFLNIMGYVDESEVNGPGKRAVIWVQGCLRECPGCFNPSSWSFEANQLISIDELVERVTGNALNEGVTFSGGEPFWQAPALAELARRLKAQGFTVMSFSGFTLEELRSPKAPPGASALLEQLDLLVDGPYLENQAIHNPTSLVSSRNQRVRVFNPDLESRLDWASDQMEIHILKDGTRIITGFRGQQGIGEAYSS
ncbi:radical SAM protein [Phormidium yuhuli AB48]|uniref:Radical SAM protein n=1 Tax=Phormidium yuhuli AB48 TaxID=2940671 RepID=A0ABY5AUT5_9CYAN|nr:4Fe-4S single cluster domain-containing protein [Phormidium yuhuli]USR93002.1 radical SAM protein [Phormidium yuhuli AB48]